MNAFACVTRRDPPSRHNVGVQVTHSLCPQLCSYPPPKLTSLLPPRVIASLSFLFRSMRSLRVGWPNAAGVRLPLGVSPSAFILQSVPFYLVQFLFSAFFRNFPDLLQFFGSNAPRFYSFRSQQGIGMERQWHIVFAVSNNPRLTTRTNAPRKLMSVTQCTPRCFFPIINSRKHLPV